MDFQDLLAWNVFWGEGGKIGERVVRNSPQRTRFYFWGFLRLWQFWWKSIKKCDRENARRRTHLHPDWQTQTGFVIWPMLYAISMGQINIFSQCMNYAVMQNIYFRCREMTAISLFVFIICKYNFSIIFGNLCCLHLLYYDLVANWRVETAIKSH